MKQIYRKSRQIAKDKKKNWILKVYLSNNILQLNRIIRQWHIDMTFRGLLEILDIDFDAEKMAFLDWKVKVMELITRERDKSRFSKTNVRTTEINGKKVDYRHQQWYYIKQSAVFPILQND